MKKFLAILILLAISYGTSLVVTCGVIKLITICFGVRYKWKIAIGIWLIICLIKPVFDRSGAE